MLGTAGVGAGVALSSITSAAASNAIDNAAYGQTWTWNSLSSGTAFTISSNSMTTGTLLSLQDTAAAATSTGKVLSISDLTTGAGYGIYSAMTATGNTGYAGYFGSSSTGTGYSLYATITGVGNTGYAGYFNNSGAGYALAATGTSTFNGSVGIGTTNPQALLQVGPVGSSAGNIIIGSNTGAASPVLGKIDWLNSSGGTWDVGSIEVDGDGPADYGDMVFKTGEATSSATEKMRITYAR